MLVKQHILEKLKVSKHTLTLFPKTKDELKQMIEDDRYCGDVLIQMSAINKALESVENSILENHMRTCMSREIKAGNMETIKEVMELIKRLR